MAVLTASPLAAWAGTSEELIRAWGAAVAPVQAQGAVVLSEDVSVQGCNLRYAFISNGGTVTDAFEFPMAEFDMVQTRAVSSAPTTSGITFILNADGEGETTKTLENGTTRIRATQYGSLFPENFTNDAAVFALLGVIADVAAKCRGSR